MLARHEHDRAAKAVVVGLLRRERFIMGCACLAAFGEISTRLRAETAVATAVGKPFCFDEKFVVRRIAQGADGRDASSFPPWESAPTMCMRISLDALPPRTERSCTRTTLAPLRAAAIAAMVPAMPPPTTTKSAVSRLVLRQRGCEVFCVFMI
jgi:hypothetical protein